ncbi:MAG: hypothetical protein ABFD54_13385 [Armatimonadota bacterium]|nr:hypothetical protein [bacterium]
MSIVFAAVILIVSPVFAEESRNYAVDELVVLNGMQSWGDEGLLDTNHEVIAPGNKSGFSLKFVWEDRPAGFNLWYVGTRLLQPGGVNPADYDRFACDLFVESTDDKATLRIFLKENDGASWICWEHLLKDAPIGKWLHIEVKKDDMVLRLQEGAKKEWNRIDSFVIQPSYGKAVYYVDNIRLLGPSGKEMDIISTADDGFPRDESWNEPIHNPPTGVAYFSYLAKKDLFEAKTPFKFAELLGKFGTSGIGAPTVHELNKSNIAMIGYSNIGGSYAKYLTKRQAWDVNYKGESYNTIPSSVKDFTGSHCAAYAHPVVTQIMREKIDIFAKSGIGVCLLADYTFPWSNGPFGYSDCMINAYREDLAGKDEGLYIRQHGKVRIIHFSDYFYSYNGFRPKPEDIGIRQWNEYTPWKPGVKGEFALSSNVIFYYLRSYEWLKLPDRTGRYYQSKGGQGMWIVPNAESPEGSSDYVFISRSVGSTNLFPEWFGNIGISAEAAYASIPYYLREEADNANNRFSVIFETGATGHAAPYWNWQVAYIASYVLSAISRADDYDNDFMDESTYEVQSNPANEQQFNRFRDGVAKAFAFQQARLESAKRNKAQILCVSERPPSRSVNSIFFAINQPSTLGLGLSRAHFLFDLRDSLDLENVINRYKVLAYSPMSPRVGDFALIRRWLDSKPGRCLITHTYVPTRDARGFWGIVPNTQLGSVDGGRVLGLGRITSTDVKQCKILWAKGVWSKFFKAGEVIKLASGLTKCEQGQAMVMTDAGPIITQAKVGKSRVVYLHFTARDPADPDFLSVSKRIALAVGIESNIKPLCDADDQTLVQAFDIKGGRSVAIWDLPSLKKWDFKYQPGIAPLEYSAPGVEKTVQFPADAKTNYIIYDFWADKQLQVSPTIGYIELKLEDHLTDLYYYGPDSPNMRATIASVRKMRQKMRDLKF